MNSARQYRYFFLCCCLAALLPACATPPMPAPLPQPPETVVMAEEETAEPEPEMLPDPGLEVAMFATSLLGVEYRYGGTSPETGLDCSGFILHVYREALGMELPRSAAQLSKEGQSVGRGDLQPGDLVFFNTRGARFSHAGIYVGDNKFIHSPRAGKRVQISDMNSNYWMKRFNGARRLAMPMTSQALAQ